MTGRWHTVAAFACGAALGAAGHAAIEGSWLLAAPAVALAALWLALWRTERERNRLEWWLLRPEAQSQIKAGLEAEAPPVVRVPEPAGQSSGQVQP